MADELVSVVVEQLASFLLDKLKEEVGLVAGARGEVKKLAATFEKIHAVLYDAENQQVKNKSVKVWLGELKDVAYEIEDLLEEWHTRILKSQMDGDDDNAGSSSSKKKVSCFLSPCSCFNKLSLHHDIGRKMKELRERLDVIAIEKDKYGFNSVTIIEDPIVRLDTISMINKSEICGRDQDKETIISKLLSESSQEQMGVPVISIVGMGGLGKTALAQIVINDTEVTNHFEKKIWVCVSDPFDVKKIAEKIIEALVDSVPTVTSSWETLHQQLCKSIQGKKILLVLDDVWTEDKKIWDQIKCALDLGAKGSRVVVTTRSDVVAVTVGSTYKHDLAILDDHDCWLLFKRLAFHGRGEEDCHRLESTGKKISNKCKGVPLYAKTLGSLMPHKRTIKDWQDVLASDLWDLPKVSKDVLPPLLLSYNALPSHLKHCFTYCAIYVKDHKLNKDVLVKLWMSQGFVRSTQTRDMEIIGGEYFDDLASRSFFQDLKIDENGDVSCKMHDLMHDFANFVANNECSIVESVDTKFDYSKTRHLSLRIRKSNDSFIPPPILNAKNLRTFFVWVYPNPRPNLDIKLLHHLTCLRTLDLSCVAIETLPNEVGSLIHLRYLDLSETKLVELPESVCNLRNLQTLKLTSCEKLRRLPEGLRKLVNLRHLELLYTSALECLPKGIEELRCLQTLSMFLMSKEGCQLRELNNLNNLRGSLAITNIRGGGSKESINLKSKEHIRTLGLQFVKEDYKGKRDDDGSAIELFEPHPNLEDLKIGYYGGSKFPNWMEFQSSSIMLRRLRILKCRNLEVLPSWAKLESLQSLILQELDSMSPMGLFNGLEASSTIVAYPNLKELVISEMKHWEEWVMETSSEDINVMPLLRDLYILNCPVLKSVPHQILSQSVRKLFIRDCPELIISWLPPLLEELGLDGDAGSLSRSLPFNDNTSLKVMWIQNSPHSTLPQGLSQLKALQTLKIVGCNSLTCIPHELQHLGTTLTSLRKLVISRCSILGPR